jgi:protocatechuate 3,4-dioxygenase beta subunit
MSLAPEHDHDHTDEWDRGLAHDLQTMMERRRALKVFAGAGAVALLAACGSESSSTATSAAGTTGNTTAATIGDTTANTTAATTGDTTAATTGSAECTTVVPEETAGPYPGDGSNGPDILTEPDVVRSDITGSIGSFTGTAEGVPTSLSLTILDSSNGCAPLEGGAVYIWHADKDGHYSMYTAPDASYLRGVQVADANGIVTFQSIWPGCYDGRWPHVHFEVYRTLDDALSASNRITTSQIALPEAECKIVYAATGYETSVSNLSRTSLSSDMVFGDGWDQQLGTATGDNDNGWAVHLGITV